METTSRSFLIADILRLCGYYGAKYGDDSWNMISYKLDSVLQKMASLGSFKNLYRHNVKVYELTDDVALSEFHYFDKVFVLPADFYRLESLNPNLKILKSEINNIYYLCYIFEDKWHPFDETISYSIKPDFEDFSWCDDVKLEEIKVEVAQFVLASREGQEFAYHINSRQEIRANRQISVKRSNGIKFKGF